MSSKKEVKITVEENNSRVRKISATIRLENLGQGSDTNNKTARDWMKSLKLGPDYHAGHIVAKQLGGSGSNLDNLVPMHAKFNNGKYKSFESDVKNFLVDGQKYFPKQDVKVEVEITVLFEPESASPKIPSRIKYCAYMLPMMKRNQVTWLRLTSASTLFEYQNNVWL